MIGGRAVVRATICRPRHYSVIIDRLVASFCRGTGRAKWQTPVSACCGSLRAAGTTGRANAMIPYLVDEGADVTANSRQGQEKADMANGPVERISQFPKAIGLLERLGSKNNHARVSC